MATILTKKSDTASAVPLAADLTNAAGGAELAVNATDKRLFSKTSGGTVVELGTNPTAMAVVGNTTVGGTLGVTGATTLAGVSATTLSASSTVTLSGGTANGVAYLNGSKVVTSGSALTFDGTTFNAPTLVTSGTANIGANLYLTANALYYHARTTGGANVRMLGINAGNTAYVGPIDSGPNDTILNASASSANIQFYASGSEQMRLTSTGLGIGTSSPAYKLSVNGASSGVVANIGYNGDSGTGLYVGVNHASNLIQLYATGTANKSMAFYTGSTEVMRYDSSGNLGLGVTPSAWDTTVFRTLQVGAGVGSASLSGRTDGISNLALGVNFYYGAGAYRYIGNGTANYYNQQSGVHAWYNASSGTAGTAITFTQAMTLDASGNLGIGTTSPSARLHVAISSGPYVARFENTSTSTSQYNTALFYQGATGSAVGYIGTGGSAVGNTAFANNFVVGTQSSSPLVFTTNDTERARIDSSGNFDLTGGGTFSSTGVYNNTTASAANVHVSSAGGLFFRSTSALKYKQDIRNLESMDIGLLRPVRYKSKCEGDDQTKDHLGLIADEAAEAGFEELVTRGENGEVEGFQYERLTVVLLKELQTLRQRVAQLEAQ